MQTVTQAFYHGGECMYAITVVLVAGAVVFLERVAVLLFKYNVNANAFMSQILKLVAANNIERAIKLCNAAPTAALPRVVKPGLVHADRDVSEIMGSIEDAVVEVVPPVKKRSGALLGAAIVAACLGLLGTVLGLIRALALFSHAGPELDPAGLADGLAASLYPVAFGLAVCIAFLVAHFFVSGIEKRIVNEINEYSVKLRNVLTVRRSSADGSRQAEGVVAGKTDRAPGIGRL